MLDPPSELEGAATTSKDDQLALLILDVQKVRLNSHHTQV